MNFTLKKNKNLKFLFLILSFIPFLYIGIKWKLNDYSKIIVIDSSSSITNHYYQQRHFLFHQTNSLLQKTTLNPEVERAHIFSFFSNSWSLEKEYGTKVPSIKVEQANCELLFKGDSFEKIQSNILRFQNNPVDDFDFHQDFSLPEISKLKHFALFLTNNSTCLKYKQKRGFIHYPVNKEERLFPIAFSILMYKDFEQFERLFRAVYRPQNYYCIHVDKKSHADFKRAVNSLVSCFSSTKVFLAPTSIDVQWGSFSVLEPELICLHELWNRFVKKESSEKKYDKKKTFQPKKNKPKWKYFINLTGQEFPLRTNWEMVQILKIFRGANNVESTVERMHSYLKSFYKLNPPPKGLHIHKGSIHVTLSRSFVDFILHDPLSLDLQKFLKDVFVPDEYFFSTLNNNPNHSIPGSYTGSNKETDPVKNRFITRFKNWGYPPFAWPCFGTWIRQICNFGIGDLPLLASRDELIANKFNYKNEPLAYDCMEELLFNRTRNEYKYKGNIPKEVLYRPKVVYKVHDSIETNSNHFYSPNREKNLLDRLYLTTMSVANQELLNQNKKKQFSNPDHKIFPDQQFVAYGDLEDGTFIDGPNRIMMMNYLRFLRPLAHKPGVVDMDHYKNLSFVKHHLQFPEE